MSAKCLNVRVITVKYLCSFHLCCTEKQAGTKDPCNVLSSRVGILRCRSEHRLSNMRKAGAAPYREFFSSNIQNLM